MPGARQNVIASASEAIHSRAKEEWIASSLTLLAMTLKYDFALSPRDAPEL